MGLLSRIICLVAVLAVGVHQACAFARNAPMRMTRLLTRSMNMAQTSVAMPALSSTMTSGKIVAWSKKVGDKISAGDVLLVVESDKADMDVESYEDGYLASIITPEGGTANVGETDAMKLLITAIRSPRHSYLGRVTPPSRTFAGDSFVLVHWS